MTSGTRRHAGLGRWTTWAAGVLVALVQLSASQSAPAKALPFATQEPRAFTEVFISQHPEAALDPGHVAILSLEPAGTPEGDTGSEEGMDRVPYVFDRPLRIRLKIDASADQVGRLVLKDGTGREVACLEKSGGTTPRPCAGESPSGLATIEVPVRPGPHALEVHHARKGQADAPVQRVFLRPRFEAAGVTLEASRDCERCDFTNALLDKQDFSGAILTGSIFPGASLFGTDFTNAKMQGCSLTAPPGNSVDPYQNSARLGGTKFIGADLTGAHFDGVLGDADFTGAILDDTTWGPQLAGVAVERDVPKVAPANMLGTFTNASLRLASFNGALLDGSIFDSATIVATDFHVFGVALEHPPICCALHQNL